MATTVKNATDIFKEAVISATDNALNFKAFLECAAMNYKYAFIDQLMIYAQKPNTTLCADYDTWNNKLNRSIRVNTKGIALLRENNGYSYLKYVFDISDTRSKKSNNDVKFDVWKVPQAFESQVIAALSEKYTFSVSENIFDNIKYVVKASLEDKYHYYLSNLYKNTENTRLQFISRDIIDEELKGLLTNSVTLIVLKRFKNNLEPYFISDNFKNISLFQDLSTLTVLGSAINDISKNILHEINAILENVQSSEIKSICTFDNDNKEIYNVVEDERRNKNDNLRRSKWNNVTKYSSEKEKTSSDRKIWNNETELFEKEQLYRLSNNVDGGCPNRTLVGSSEDSRNESGTNDRGNGEEREYNRRIESQRPNEVDRPNEQLESESRRNSNERTNLQLEFYDDSDVVTEEKINWLEKERIELIKQEKQIEANFVETPKTEDTIFDYRYKIGDKVYIGADKFEILAIDNDIVRLYDYQYPLFNQEYSFEEFDRKVKENPCNDYLKVEVITKNEIKEFNDIEFEKQISYNMRFKETSFVEDGLYWITQEGFTQADLIKFQEALNKTDIEKAYITVRDLSNYVFEDDLAKNNLVIITKDSINYTGYLEYGIKSYGNDFNDYFFKKEEQKEYEAYDDEVDLIDNKDFERLKEYRKKYETKVANQEKLESDLIGKNITIGDREYIIDNIDNDVVSLKDVTFQNGVGFPIFRDEELSRVLSILAEKENEQKNEIIIPNIAKKQRRRVTTFDIHPEIKNEDRNNFHIIDDMLGVGTDREKFNRNIEAIKVLKQCEEENRFATPKEQQILSQYIGWGGLSQVFEENNSSWADEHLKLKNILDEEEYRSAMSSTRTSFYTPPIVIRTMYKALESMGMKDGNILEPSCGVGNFLGMIPDTLKACKLYGVEVDSISGRIARQLYQKSSIAVQGFENTELPDSFFDGAIGNVPFDSLKLLDKRYDKYNFLIHDYFFAKTLDKVRPGGIVAFITSKGTLDKENPSVRKYIAQRADLLGAIRLPNNTFKDNAGTKVTSDIIFLQKRNSITDIEPDWVYLDTDDSGIKMNRYFIDNPDMICGNMKMESTRFGMDSTCEAREDITLDDLIMLYLIYTPK